MTQKTLSNKEILSCTTAQICKSSLFKISSNIQNEDDDVKGQKMPKKRQNYLNTIIQTMVKEKGAVNSCAKCAK